MAKTNTKKQDNQIKKISAANYQRYINGIKFVVTASSVQEAEEQFKEVEQELAKDRQKDNNSTVN